MVFPFGFVDDFPADLLLFLPSLDPRAGISEKVEEYAGAAFICPSAAFPDEFMPMGVSSAFLRQMDDFPYVRYRSAVVWHGWY